MMLYAVVRISSIPPPPHNSQKSHHGYLPFYLLSFFIAGVEAFSLLATVQ